MATALKANCDFWEQNQQTSLDWRLSYQILTTGNSYNRNGETEAARLLRLSFPNRLEAILHRDGLLGIRYQPALPATAWIRKKLPCSAGHQAWWEICQRYNPHFAWQENTEVSGKNRRGLIKIITEIQTYSSANSSSRRTAFCAVLLNGERDRSCENLAPLQSTSSALCWVILDTSVIRQEDAVWPDAVI